MVTRKFVLVRSDDSPLEYFNVSSGKFECDFSAATKFDTYVDAWVVRVAAGQAVVKDFSPVSVGNRYSVGGDLYTVDGAFVGSEVWFSLMPESKVSEDGMLMSEEEILECVLSGQWKEVCCD